MMRKRLISISALVLAASVIGSGTSLARSHISVARVAAATHCTRYAPVISQDVNCTVSGTMDPTGFYSTPSTALRDLNLISLAANRSWLIWYVGGNNLSGSGFGTFGQINSSNGFAYARCSFSSTVTTGHCRTSWHD